MKLKNKKAAAVCLLFILITAAAAVSARMIYLYAGDVWRPYALAGIGLTVLIYFFVEALSLLRIIRRRSENTSRSAGNIATAIVLVNENAEWVSTWDLRNRTGLVIGRSSENEDADIDLSGSEYFSTISNQHATLNYTEKGWYLADAGSKNGTALSHEGSVQKLILAPGEPVPIRSGDTIYIAEETILAVR